MISRAQALGLVNVGDIVFGHGAGGQDKLLLVYKTDIEGFSARHVTTQIKYRFNRSGMTRIYADGGFVKIVSTAQLPPDQLQIALELDRKMGSGVEYPDTKLSQAEIQFLLTYVAFFEAHRLPDT